MDFSDFVFLVSAVLCLASAASIVWQKNPVYSVVYMLPFFVGMTVIFVLLQAAFLAAIQMIVYGGAILVVFLFVIMLINLKPEELRDDWAIMPYALTSIGVAFLGGAIVAAVHDGVTPAMQKAFLDPAPAKNVTTTPIAFGSIGDIATPLFNQYMIPFELTSVLIVVAILGAVLLSKKRV